MIKFYIFTERLPGDGQEDNSYIESEGNFILILSISDVGVPHSKFIYVFLQLFILLIIRKALIKGIFFFFFY